MTIITTATGKEFDTGYVAENYEIKALYIRISNAEKETVESVFSDPDETRTLHYNGKTFEGYTSFKYAIDEGDAIKVRLNYGQL